MRKKKIDCKKIKDKFTMKPLFDDSDIYKIKKIDDNTSIEQLDQEIDGLIEEIRKNK
ncbi:MAG: hypothetical protein HFJ48_04065 [Clostridia bacterium]|nr:hypothetical protein [Clostridia bacterium]